jgi:hypothetical protein
MHRLPLAVLLLLTGVLLVPAWPTQAAGAAVHQPTATGVPDGALLPAWRIVAYYGNPLAGILGVLGELPPEQMLARLQAQADAYAAADPTRPVQPALQLIAVMARAGAGNDDRYRARMDPELIDKVAGWAEDRGYLLILDVQLGRSSVAAEVGALEDYLRRPYVHLALDPEFAMAPGQVPGEAIGRLNAATINWAVDYLGELVTAEQLPPKVLIVHRFLPSMVPDPTDIRTDPRVQVVLDMDGFGSPSVKVRKYYDLVAGQPASFAGIKLFYRHDTPLLAPEAVLDLDPDVIIYQ